MREGGYLRRLYRVFNDKNYQIQPQAKEEIIQRRIKHSRDKKIGKKIHRQETP